MVKDFSEFLFQKILGKSYNFISFLILILMTTVKNFPAGLNAVKNVVYKQVYFTGIEALKITVQFGFFMGIVVVAQIASFIKGIGGVNLVGKIIVIAMVRELIPLLMAIIIIARSGTAIASELGLMKVNGEIQTITSLGIDPLYYIVASRMFAFIMSLTVITVVAAFIAVMTGSVATFIFQKVAFYDYFESLFINLSIFDIILFFLKTFSFATVISLVCCYYGLSVKKSVTEIPQVSTKAVMSSFFNVFLLNVLLDFLVLVWQ